MAASKLPKSGIDRILVSLQTGKIAVLQDDDEDPLDAFMAEQINPEVAAAEKAEAEARERRRVEQAKQIAVSLLGGAIFLSACACGIQAVSRCKPGRLQDASSGTL